MNVRLLVLLPLALGPARVWAQFNRGTNKTPATNPVAGPVATGSNGTGTGVADALGTSLNTFTPNTLTVNPGLVAPDVGKSNFVSGPGADSQLQVSPEGIAQTRMPSQEQAHQQESHQPAAAKDSAGVSEDIDAHRQTTQSTPDTVESVQLAGIQDLTKEVKAPPPGQSVAGVGWVRAFFDHFFSGASTDQKPMKSAVPSGTEIRELGPAQSAITQETKGDQNQTSVAYARTAEALSPAAPNAFAWYVSIKNGPDKNLWDRVRPEVVEKAQQLFVFAETELPALVKQVHHAFEATQRENARQRARIVQKNLIDVNALLTQSPNEPFLQNLLSTKDGSGLSPMLNKLLNPIGEGSGKRELQVKFVPLSGRWRIDFSDTGSDSVSVVARAVQILENFAQSFRLPGLSGPYVDTQPTGLNAGGDGAEQKNFGIDLTPRHYSFGLINFYGVLLRARIDRFLLKYLWTSLNGELHSTPVPLLGGHVLADGGGVRQMLLDLNVPLRNFPAKTASIHP